MRNRFIFLGPVLNHLGTLLKVFSPLCFLPLGVSCCEGGLQAVRDDFPAFALPAIFAFITGAGLVRFTPSRSLSARQACLVCIYGWIIISALAAWPYLLSLDIPILDCYFESVSGLTTTGITLLRGLDLLPKSILFWRSLTQAIGGLGILTFFLLVTYRRSAAHLLFQAEGHKIRLRRPRPGLYNTLFRLMSIYAGLIFFISLLLFLEGVSVFDAVCHGLTTLSTGGFSPHDASISYFTTAGFTHHRLIEYTLILGMMAGGTSFLVHDRLLAGQWSALWDSREARLWWALIGVATVLVFLDQQTKGIYPEDLEVAFRRALFQVVSIITTTGYATADIGGRHFSSLSMQIFLLLMIIGGCVGSTAGGVKVLRLGILWELFTQQIRSLAFPYLAFRSVVIDGEAVSDEEMKRVASFFFMWMVLLVAGAMITAGFTTLGPLEGASGMFSALGNIGPCYIDGPTMIALPWEVKFTYILGMLAGRLEIFPLLMLLSPRTWR